jgi:hypothetical protein
VVGGIWRLILVVHRWRLAKMAAQGKSLPTQTAIGEAGGTRQNYVSRMDKTKQGPTVEVFFKIVRGKGDSPGGVLADVERLVAPLGQAPWSVIPGMQPAEPSRDPASPDAPTPDEVALAIGRAAIRGYPEELAQILADRSAPTGKRPT